MFVLRRDGALAIFMYYWMNSGVFMYCIVPGKCPWALTAQVPKIEGGRFAWKKSLNIPTQGPTPDAKLATRGY